MVFDHSLVSCTILQVGWVVRLLLSWAKFHSVSPGLSSSVPTVTWGDWLV